MNEECANGCEEAYLVIVDEEGAHYECPNCERKWIDESFEPDMENHK